MAVGIGRISSDALGKQIQAYSGPIAAPKPAPKQQATQQVGPTSKWARLSQVGTGMWQKAQILASSTGKEVYDTGRMQVAAHSNNPKAFTNANKAAQNNTSAPFKTATKVAQGTVNAGKSIVSPLTDTVKQANKNVVQPILHPQKGPGVANIMQAQGEAQAAQKAGRVSPQTLKTLGQIQSPQDKVAAYKIVADKSLNSKQMQAKLVPIIQKQSAQTKRAIGDALGITSLVVGGGELKGATTGVKAVVKSTAKNAGLGATASASGTLANNPNASKKELAKSAAEGAVIGGGTTLAGKVASKAFSKTKSASTPEVTPTTTESTPKTVTPSSKPALISDMKSGKVGSPKVATKPATQAAEAAREQTDAISQIIKRPKAAPKETEPLINTNKPVKSLVDKLTPASLKGKLNPVDAAARQGHTTFSDTIRNVAGRKIYALRQGNNISNQFDKLYANYLAKGGTHQQFIKDIESGNLGTEAHKFWDSIHSKVGQQLSDTGITKGARSNYVGRVGQFDQKGFKQGGSGLSKSGSFSKSRSQATVDEFGNSSDQFKTHAEYKQFVESNGGKVLSDPRDIIRHTLPSKLEAVQNATGLSKLDKTAMADGRAATITYNQSKGLPKGYTDYNSTIVPGRAVHPNAMQTVKALVHTYTPEEIHNPIAKINSTAKQIITLNGLIHGKNFGLASLRKQGAIHTAQAFVQSRKDLATTYGEDNIKRAIIKGGVVPFEQAKQDLFDKLSNPTASKSWSNVVHLPGKVAEHERDVLFNKVGNHLQFSTYFNVEKQMLKQGLSQDEAARVAGQAAKNVSFISSPVETSVEYRKAARQIFFAGQYFKSTLNEAAKAVGVSKDKSLSGAAQRAVQKNAIKGIARGATYLLGLAQGINYAVTGHSTFQNKDSKISPVFYVDKTTGKEYHITNWYGQIGDILHLAGNPGKEMINKAAPLVQEGSRILQGYTSGAPDPYTGQTVIDKNASGARQTSQAIGNFIENMVTPFGFQLSNTQRSTPGTVNVAKFLGYGASTVDQNKLEKDILNRYYATLPAGASKTSPAMSTLEAAARNDIAKGNKNSQSVQQLKSQMTTKQFSTFMKSGGDTAAQRAFDKLPTDQKLQIVEKYSPQQLKQLNLQGLAKSLVDSSSKSTIQSLQGKGYNSGRIQQDLQKVNITKDQLVQIKAEAKRQSAITSKNARHNPKFVNPLLK